MVAVAIRVHAQMLAKPFPAWNVTATPDINHEDFILPWDDAVTADLTISESIHRVASDPAKARLGTSAKLPQEVLQSSMYGSTQVLPTFMARYGSQHKLSDKHMNEFAYLCFFLRQPHLMHGVGCFILLK